MPDMQYLAAGVVDLNIILGIVLLIIVGMFLWRGH